MTGYVFGAAGLLVSAHPEGHALDEIGFLFADAIIPNTLDGIVNGQQIVSIDLHAFHPIPFGLIYE